MSKIRKLEQLVGFEDKIVCHYSSTVTQLQNSMAKCNSNDIAAEKDCQVLQILQHYYSNQHFDS